jgi:predicted phage-related endonuclease
MVGKLTPDNQLSASRIPVLLNASPYQTRNELLAEMIDIDRGGTPTRIPQNEPMFWGDTLENQILTVAAERLGLKDLRTSFPAAFQHPTLPLAASLDGSAKGNRKWAADPANGIYTPQGGDMIDLTGEILLEAKNTSVQPENPPAAHRGPLQLQAQMLCTGLKAGVIAVLYRGTELRLFLYKADPAIQQRIVLAVQDFEERRKTGEMYPVTSPQDGIAAYPTGVSDRLYWDDGASDEATAIDCLMHALKQKANAEEDIAEFTSAIMDWMGTSDEAEAIVGNRRVLVKWPSRTYRAQPEKVTPAKPERTVRSKTLQIKELD